MAEIYLVRHPESQHNLNPAIVSGRSNSIPLSEKGYDQARQFSEAFNASYPKPDVVYSSPAQRTRTLAEIYTEQNSLSLPILIDNALQEMSQGIAEGCDRSSIYTPDVLKRIDQELFDFKLQEGESLHEVGSRMLDWMDHAYEMHPNGTILAFTHGQAIRSVVGRLLDWSHHQTTIDPAHVTPNVSVTHLSKHDGDITVNYMGRVIIPRP
jgi:broad specificity phosphatase PhoE